MSKHQTEPGSRSSILNALRQPAARAAGVLVAGGLIVGCSPENTPAEDPTPSSTVVTGEIGHRGSGNEIPEPQETTEEVERSGEEVFQDLVTRAEAIYGYTDGGYLNMRGSKQHSFVYDADDDGEGAIIVNIVMQPDGTVTWGTSNSTDSFNSSSPLPGEK